MSTKETRTPLAFDILTLFPGMFKGPFNESILKRAQQEGLIEINVHNLRQWAEGKNSITDDEPYGGGVGMVMKPEPIFKAVREIKDNYSKTHDKKEISHVLLMTPQGVRYNYRITEKLAALNHVIIVCGHYEGVDHRVFEHLADERLSVGDYILTGGEIPAMVVVDSVSRHIEGVLGKAESKQQESFQYSDKNILKHPVYTRPAEFEGMQVPEILLSGNHREIERWRKESAEKLTKEYRPDLVR